MPFRRGSVRIRLRVPTLAVCLAGSVASAQAPATQPGAVAATASQFATLRWLEGTWRGQGVGGAPFYERYTFVDDSTIQMASFTDSTFRRSSEGDRIRLREGRIRYENALVTALDRSHVDFSIPGSAGGFAWARRPDGGWTATIRRANRAPVVYRMERVTPADSAAAGSAEAVRQAVLDYVEGFYEGDTARLARSVWPQVRKYGYGARRDSAGAVQYRGMTMAFPEGFFGYAERVRSGGVRTPAGAPKEIEIFDVQDQTASARLRAWWGIDYLLLGREQGRWMITHVLWQSAPPGATR